MVKNNLYCFNFEQTKEIAYLVLNSSVNDSIIASQGYLIDDYRLLISNRDDVISNQETMLKNKDLVIENNKSAFEKRKEIFNTEEKKLKDKHKAEKKKMRLIIAIEAAVLLLVLIVK